MNIKRHSDRLDNLLAKYEQEIRETEEKLRVLKAKRSHLTLMMKEPEKPAAPQPEPEKIRDTGITRSVMDVLSELWPVRKDAITLTED